MVKTKNVISYSLNCKKTWLNCWYLSKKNYGIILQEDFSLHLYIRSLLYHCNLNLNVLKLRIYRNNSYILIDLFLSCIKMLDLCFFSISSIYINKILDYNKNVFLFIHRINYDYGFSYASFIVMKIGYMLEKKIKLKSKVFKSFLNKILDFCLGVKIQCSGRLNNVDMARTTTISLGYIPLQSLRLNVDFSFLVINTKTGLQGIKVWIFK